MLTYMEPVELRKLRLFDKSIYREFANKTLIEFLEKAKVGDVFEVTGFPDTGEDLTKLTQKIRQAIDTERFYEDKRSVVKVFQRKGRLFLERTETYEQRQQRLREEEQKQHTPRILKPAI